VLSLADGRGGSGAVVPGLLRITIAAAAAPAAASIAVPARTFGHRRDCGFGGSSLRAVAASMADTRGATVSCTETLPLAARTAIHARALPILGMAQSAAPPARRLAVTAAFFVIGAAWSASFAACVAIFLACHCMAETGMPADFFLVITDTELPPP